MLIKWIQDVKFAFLTAFSLIGTSVMDLLEAIPDTTIAKIAGLVGILVGLLTAYFQFVRSRRENLESKKLILELQKMTNEKPD